MKTYRPGVEGTGSVIAWFYSNETTFAAATLYGALGMMAGLGMVMLTPSYKWLKGDSIQAISCAFTILSINAFAVATSMKVLERDFKYEPYNKWDASMTYLWRLIPMVYIPVDYFEMNRKIMEGGERPRYQHPVYSWVDYDYENDYGYENDLPEDNEQKSLRQ